MSHVAIQAETVNPMSGVAATDIIPHRPPFLMVDRILETDAGQSALSSYRVDPGNPVFDGHFPGFAVLPGVLLIENMAQTACCVVAAAAGKADDALYVLVRVNQCTFQRMVRPGDELITRACRSRDLGQFIQFDCQVHVGDQCVARAELLVTKRNQEK